jgi:hypothetical protein
MPKFLSSHKIGNVQEEQLRQAQNMPKDEHGVTHENILYSYEEDKLFCLHDGPGQRSGKTTSSKTRNFLRLDCWGKDHSLINKNLTNIFFVLQTYSNLL